MSKNIPQIGSGFIITSVRTINSKIEREKEARKTGIQKSVSI